MFFFIIIILQREEYPNVILNEYEFGLLLWHWRDRLKEENKKVHKRYTLHDIDNLTLTLPLQLSYIYLN